MMLTKRFDDALVFASRLHRRQRVKKTNIPYVSHLMAVSALVLEYGGDEDQAIAALLHDAVEDQGGEATRWKIERRFGRKVARIVADCTDAWTEPKPEWRKRKESYLAAMQKKSKRSLLVALADKVHNARAIRRDYQELGDKLWSRFNGGKDGTLWYYKSMSRRFTELLPGPLANELKTTVAAFSRR